MLFSSMIFLWCFLPITLFFYFFAKDRYRNYVLLVASIIFYAWGEPIYILLMLFSILCNYSLGIAMDRSVSATGRKWLLVVCVAVNIGLLWYFKYSMNCFNFANSIFKSDIFPVKIITLPIGISFYTFQSMSYVIDLYRREIPVQKNVLNLALYISFFPQLIAGPIVKYKDVNKQLKCRTITETDVAYGIKRFIYGLGKKVIISNTMAEIVDGIFVNDIQQLGTGLLWFGVGAYTLQIYYDFSGYSDMAIGLGRMFGFRFLENFDYPYISSSIKEFWRRWHISLSGWFRDYVYIPLGGNRRGMFRTYINLFVVFLLTGIWHGASLNFLCWGLWHGFFIILERIWLGKLLEKNSVKIINHLYTMFVVAIGWAMFRCASFEEAIRLLRAMFSWRTPQIYTVNSFVSNRGWFILVIGIIMCGIFQTICPKARKQFTNAETSSVIEYSGLLIILLVSIIYLVSGTYNPFIYFQF